MKPAFTIREAEPSDVPRILEFIRELAAYEKLSHEANATEAMLRQALFGERRYAEVVLGCENGEPAGFALFFHNFSTFVGKPGLYLEDLFVRPSFRGRGYGKALMIYLAQLAVQRDCGRFEWWVLDWNKPALEFYSSIGAVPMNDWTVQRLTGAALARLAQATL